MADPIAEAFIIVRPDTSKFAAELQAQLNAIIAKSQVKPVTVPVKVDTAGVQDQLKNTAASAQQAAASSEGLAGAQRAASAAAKETAVATQGLAASQAEVTSQSFAQLKATAALEAANLRVARAERELALAQAGRITTTRTLAGSQAALTAALASQAQAQGAFAAANEVASRSLLTTSQRANLARGAFIGISRITPVTIFGLGAIGTVAAGAGLALFKSVQGAAEFERNLNILQATINATAGEMEQIRTLANDLGADLQLPGVSASDATVAILELSKAGLELNDSLAATESVLQLSIAGNLSAGDAAEIVATQLNAFSLAGTEAANVANLLAGSAVNAQGEIQDFGAAFAQTAAVANQVGLSIEQTSSLLTILARSGLRGSDAGTSLRTTLLRLTPTTKQAADYAKALGINLDETRSIGEQLPEVIDQYREALAVLTPIQQQQALAQIFGQDAIRAASIIFGQQAGAIEEVTKQITSQNFVQQQAAARAKGLSGSIEGLSSTAETLGVTLGQLVDGPLEGLINALSDTLTIINRVVRAVPDLVDAIEEIPVVGDAVSAFGRLTREAFIAPFEDLGGYIDDLANLGTGDLNKPLLDEAARTTAELRATLIDAGPPIKEAAKESFTLPPPDLGEFNASLRELPNTAADSVQATADILAGLANVGLLQAPGQSLDAFQQELVARSQALGRRVADGFDEELAKVKLEQLKNAAYAAGLGSAEAIVQGFKEGLVQSEIDVTLPLRLQIEGLEAQRTDTLQDNLAAAEAEAARFADRLATIPENQLERRRNVLEQLVRAEDQVRSIENQIKAQQEKATAESEKRKKDAQRAYEQQIANEVTRLRLAAEATEAITQADRRYVAFLRDQAQNARLSTEQRLRYQEALQDELRNQADLRDKIAEELERNAQEDAEAAARLRESLLQLKFERIDLSILRAEINTPDDVRDDVKRLERKLTEVNKQADIQRKIAAAEKRGSQEQVDAALEVVALENQALEIKRQIRDKLKQDEKQDSASFEDFLRAAVENFRSFGPGGTGLLSAQDVRGDLAARVLGRSTALAASIAQQAAPTTTAGGARRGIADPITGAINRMSQQQARSDAALLIETRKQTGLLRSINRSSQRLGRALLNADEVANRTRGE